MNFFEYFLPKKLTKERVAELITLNSFSAFLCLGAASLCAGFDVLSLTIVFLVLGVGCTHNAHDLQDYARKRGWVRK